MVVYQPHPATAVEKPTSKALRMCSSARSWRISRKRRALKACARARAVRQSFSGAKRSPSGSAVDMICDAWTWICENEQKILKPDIYVTWMCLESHGSHRSHEPYIFPIDFMLESEIQQLQGFMKYHQPSWPPTSPRKRMKKECQTVLESQEPKQFAPHLDTQSDSSCSVV